MIKCTRFENEGLLILEKGEELDEHFHNCEVCLEEQRKYQSLKALIFSSSLNSKPEPDWQSKVLGSVNNSNSSDPIKKNNYWYGKIAAGFAIIAVIGLFFQQLTTQSSLKPSLEISLISSGKLYRGENAKIGDQLIATVSPSVSVFTELRIYRDGRLYYSCNTNKQCNANEKLMKASIKLAAIGEYQVTLTQSNKKISLHSLTIDKDVLKARDLGAEVTVSKSVDVR